MNSFFESLIEFNEFDQFYDKQHYTPLPHDWFVVMSDIQNSTQAIKAGKYKEVNAMGVATIVVILNAIQPLKIPYIFGGDGATLCIPPNKQEEVIEALSSIRNISKLEFNLTLRVGMVPMKDILKAGHSVLVAKYKPTAHYEQAMLLGEGLRYAESLIKDDKPSNPYLIQEGRDSAKGDYSGFECRWEEVPSPQEETISLLVQALGQDEEEKQKTFTQVSQIIKDIYGDETKRHPLRENNLALTNSPKKLSIETRIRNGNRNTWAKLIYQIKLIFLTIGGNYVLSINKKSKSTDWGRYKSTLITNSDYRKFDELLRMVMAGTSDQRRNLRAALDDLRNQGKVVYGLHQSKKSLLTCIVSDYKENHVHFLDGSDGGYFLAAVELKSQLKSTKPSH